MKTIKLNGEFTEKQLLQKIEELKKSTWKISKRVSLDGALMLFSSESYSVPLTVGEDEWKKYFVGDFSRLVYKIARAMGYLATPEQIMNSNKRVQNVFYALEEKEWQTNWETNNPDQSLIIDTEEHAEEIAKLLNDSPAIKEWLEYCKGIA